MKNLNSFRHRSSNKWKINSQKFSVILLTLCVGIFFSSPSSLSAQPLANGLDKFIGAGTSTPIWRNFTLYWNQVTPGNSGKWGSVEAVQGNYSWTDLDQIYNFANSRHIPFKEHTLIWGNQAPSWITFLDSAQQSFAIENWIKNVAERYQQTAYVDVVNEPIRAVPAFRTGLGGDGATGYDWVIKAFQLARKYYPSTTKLILNEYNILADYTATTNYITIINLLKDRGLIDGIGIQGHYFEFRSHVNATNGTYVYSPATLKSNLDRIGNLGLPIYITEFDIDESDDSNQLAQYQIYFPVFWTHPAVKGITLWGYIQNDVWTDHPDTYLILTNGTERPALTWLREYVLKPIQPVLIAPIGTSNELRNAKLIWRSSFLATSYRVQISSVRSFTTVAVDSTVADTTLQLSPLAANTTYYWRVSAINDKGTSEYSNFVSFTTGIVGVEEINSKPADFKLFQNYPNPFNPTTTISFSLPQRSQVRLVILDLLGREISNLAEGNYEAGIHTVEFNASNLSTGVYFYRLEAGNFVSSKKLIYLK